MRDDTPRNPDWSLHMIADSLQMEDFPLRDFFAGCALISLVDRIGLGTYYECDAAQSAYLVADAMLDARGGE